MEYGICHISVAPVRAESTDRSEMVTQLLFGDLVLILNWSDNRKWAKIRHTYDGYEGWLDVLQYTPISEADHERLSTQNILASEAISPIRLDDTVINVSIGSQLPDFVDGRACIGDQQYPFPCCVLKADHALSGEEICILAYLYLRVPYLWGGRSIFGIDCSGLVQQVFKLGGYWLPRDASQQVTHGKEVTLAESRAGDIAYFINEAGRTVHVGIILEGQRIIHAHGQVRIDTLDEKGIYNKERDRHTHQLSVIKRMLGNG